MRNVFMGTSVVLLLVACGAKDAPVQISAVQVQRATVASASSYMSISERLGLGPVAATSTSASASHQNCPHTAQGVKGACCPEESPDTAVQAQRASLIWDTPPSWTEGQEKPLRLGTYKLGENALTECYVTALPGAAGGLAANIERWREQMGRAPLGNESIEALPTLTVLGDQSRYVEIRGNFTDMAGETYPEFMMIGLVSQLPNQAVFVKMVGPEEEVLSEKSNFIAFCESLQFGNASG